MALVELPEVPVAAIRAPVATYSVLNKLLFLLPVP